MTIQRRVLAVSLVLALTLTLGYASANPPEKDLFAIMEGATIPLEAAIQAAEKTVSGITIKAELENDSNPNTYRIVIADSGSRTITYLNVDSSSGVVLESRTYRVDAKVKPRIKARKG